MCSSGILDINIVFIFLGMYTLWINVIIGSLVQRLACISIHCSWSNFQILVWGSKSHLELTRNCYVVYILNTNFIHIKLVTLMVYLFGIIKLTSGLTFLHSFSFISCSSRRKHVTSLFLHNKCFHFNCQVCLNERAVCVKHDCYWF